MAKPLCATQKIEGSVPSARSIPFAVAYKVDEHGNVYGKRNQIMMGFVDKKGYKRVGLWVNGKRRHFYNHVCVLTAFIGACPVGYETRHLDGNPSNNHLSNLVWGSRQENADDRSFHGTVAKGSNNGGCKLTALDVIGIRRRVAAGETVKNLCIEFSMSEGGMRSLINGRKWKHLPGAFKRKPGPKKVLRD